jgi:hypothetical protein
MKGSNVNYGFSKVMDPSLLPVTYLNSNSTKDLHINFGGEKARQ